MKCRTPHRDGYFTSGPALPGTVCGSSMVKHKKLDILSKQLDFHKFYPQNHSGLKIYPKTNRRKAKENSLCKSDVFDYSGVTEGNVFLAGLVAFNGPRSKAVGLSGKSSRVVQVVFQNPKVTHFALSSFLCK